MTSPAAEAPAGLGKDAAAAAHSPCGSSATAEQASRTAAAAAALPRLPSSVSLASIVSVVPSEAHCCYSRHIIVAIDNSSSSTHALEWTLRHLYRPRDKLHLVHIIPEPPTLHPWPGVFVPPDDALEREEFQEASAMVAAAFAPLVNQQAVPCDAHLIVAPEDPSNIVSILLDKQQELDAAAVVVAPHGNKSGLQEWWLGSVTKGLLHHSTVPVVVVVPATPSSS